MTTYQRPNLPIASINGKIRLPISFEKVSKKYTFNPSIHNMEAPRHIAPLVMNMVRPQSVLDVGCGIGTWLKAFHEMGVEDYLGIDGHHERDSLVIPKEKFQERDLSGAWALDRKF